MFLKEILTVGEQALKQVFTPNYITSDGYTDFANLYVSIEYPIHEQNYPAVWMDFEIDGYLTRSGIDGYFAMLPEGTNPNTFKPLYCWRGAGWFTYTAIALTNLERARLHDELVRVFAFNQISSVNPYRYYIENNPYIAMNVNFDDIAERSSSVTPGTPWGSEDLMYEMTLAIQVGNIEFYALDNNTLVSLDQVQIQASDMTENYQETLTGSPYNSWSESSGYIS